MTTTNFDYIQPLTLQELFDKALFGIRQQGYQKSLHPTIMGQCRYRGGEGDALKCAIGHAIPDDLYDEYFDNTQHGTTAVGYVLNPDKWGERDRACVSARNKAQLLRQMLTPTAEHMDLAVELQGAHDSYLPSFVTDPGSPRRWEVRMREIALKFELTYTHPDDDALCPIDDEVDIPEELLP